LLSDLHRKLGSWELALAAYEIGPFGLLAQLQRAGAETNFWDLLQAGRLPAESASYVPRVQAFALILANLEHFQFQRAQPASAPPASVALVVPSGTRLGLLARAASCSATRIRELNPELLGDTVPGNQGEQFTLQVPSQGAPTAREQLERLIAQADGADECVPLNFDWGRQRFTRAMQDRCKR
jgi:membrane-bound lytic murein transglycosylase D